MSSESALVARIYDQVTAAIDGLGPEDLAKPTLADGWTVADLTFHLLLDAQRVLVTLASPTDQAPDVDRATYWRPFRPGAHPDSDAAHAEYVRRSAAAYGTADTVTRHWRDTAAAAGRAALAADEFGLIATQGHVLTVPDFLSTIVVEATVHYLDLTYAIEAPPADPESLAHTIAVLEQIAGTSLPTGWDPADAVLRCTGRAPLTPGDRSALGPLADRLPLLG